MASLTGSLTNFSGEPREEGLVFGFEKRGEPEELRGESGGVLPAGNMEGSELIPVELALKEFPWELLIEMPDDASSMRDLTCQIRQ